MVKKSMLLGIIALGVLGACADKKTKEVKVDASAVEEAKTELSKEASATEADIEAAKKKVEDSLRKVDSLVQVKTHGHAH